MLSGYTVTKVSDRYLDLKSEQWEMLTALKDVLHPLPVATAYFSAEYNVSVSTLYLVLHGLLKSLQCSDDELLSIQACKTTIEQEIKRRWKLGSLTSIATGDILKDAPLMACIIDARFKECKFLGPEKHIQVKGVLSGLICKEKALLEEKQGSPSSQISEINDNTNERTFNSEGDPEDSDPVLKEINGIIFEREANR